jgi:hypothetical protein
MRTTQHCAEVVDEMGLVVPTEANSEVGVVDAGVTFDLQRGLLPTPTVTIDRGQTPMYWRPDNRSTKRAVSRGD